MEAAISPHVVAVESRADFVVRKIAGRHRHSNPFELALVFVPSPGHEFGCARGAWAVLRADRAHAEFPRRIVGKIEIEDADLLIRYVNEPLLQLQVILGSSRWICHPF